MAHTPLSPRSLRQLHLRGLAVALLALAISACRITDLPLWGPADMADDAYEVEQIQDIAYCDGPDADPFRHRLDLFLPKGLKDYPVVMLVHGGAWVMGDNRCCGLYPAVAEFLAGQGIGVVMPNYRLSPQVRHPEHIRDVARAFAWTHAHIAEYGGQPDQLFVAGHSAGGHLVSLLATNETYLLAEGLRSSAIKGVIVVSGVYKIPEGKLRATLGGATPLAFRFDEMNPLRRGSGRMWPPLPFLPGIPISLNVFGPMFGNDPVVRADASPLYHVRPGLPPFLLFSAENDLPILPEMAVEFYQALRAQQCEAQLIRVADRNHNSIMFRAIELADPVAQELVAFIRRHIAARPSLP